jgi:hypothetical protein
MSFCQNELRGNESIVQLLVNWGSVLSSVPSW